jgi:hypothetical protein
MAVVKKIMKLGQNPAKELTSSFFSINQCGNDVTNDVQLTAQSVKTDDVQLSAQGITDVFKFLDPVVLNSITGFIKEIDINEIKKIITLGSKLFEIDDKGNIFVNLRIKLNNVKNNP